MIGCSSTPWATDCDVAEDTDYKEKECARRHRYSKGRLCPICGEPMTNNASTCADCLPLQKANPIVAAAKMRTKAEKLRRKLEVCTPEEQVAILATKLWEGSKLAATVAKIGYQVEKEREESWQPSG